MIVGIILPGFLGVVIAVSVCIIRKGSGYRPEIRLGGCGSREKVNAKKILAIAGFVLQNVVSVPACMLSLVLLAWIGPLMSSLVTGMRGQQGLLPIMFNAAGMLAVVFIILYPVTYIAALIVTIKRGRIGRISFLPAVQLFVCFLVYFLCWTALEG